jgi:hypothetical protein
VTADNLCALRCARGCARARGTDKREREREREQACEGARLATAESREVRRRGWGGLRSEISAWLSREQARPSRGKKATPVETYQLAVAPQHSGEVWHEQKAHGSAKTPPGERACAIAGVHGCACPCAGTGAERVLTVARPAATAKTSLVLLLREGRARKQNDEQC